MIAQLTNEGELMMIEHFRELDANIRATLEGLSPTDVKQLVQAAQTTVDVMAKTGLRHIVACKHDA